MNADILGEFPKLALCLNHDEKEQPKLVIVKVYLGSPLDASRSDFSGNITEGSIVKFVNGYQVTNIEDYRKSLMNPIEGRFFSIITEKDTGDIIRMSKVLGAERYLSKQYGYPLSETYKHYLDLAENNHPIAQPILADKENH